MKTGECVVQKHVSTLDVAMVAKAWRRLASNPGTHRLRIYDRREEGLGKPSFCLKK